METLALPGFRPVAASCPTAAACPSFAAHSQLPWYRSFVMTPSISSLTLTSFLQKQRVLLVQPTDAIRLCRDCGYEKLPRPQALLFWATVSRFDRNQMSSFVLQSRLTSFSLSRLNHLQLVECLHRWLKSGALEIVRECINGTGSESSSLVLQRRLVRTIESETHHVLSYEGRKYKLVAGDDLGREPNRNHYEVVGRIEAIRVLAGLMKQSGPFLVKLFAEARDRLTPDWRPPLNPDGIILLIGTVQARAAGQTDSSETRPARPKAPADAPALPQELEEPDFHPVCQPSTLTNASRSGQPFCPDFQEAHAPG
jgi:hypothetical protein